MVVYLDQPTIESFKRGEPLTPDLIRVLDESGDPRWIECLLRRFQDVFFQGDSVAYYDFADVVDVCTSKQGYRTYISELKKRLQKAFDLKRISLGRDLTEAEKMEEVERNHISKDFRLYFLLEYPGCCAINMRHLQKRPVYSEALSWLLSTAQTIKPEVGYRNLIPDEKSLESLALAS